MATFLGAFESFLTQSEQEFQPDPEEGKSHVYIIP